MNNKIIVQATGEVLDLDQKITAMSNPEKSDALTKINLMRKLIEKVEKKLKKWIKEEYKLEFDEETDEAFFEDHRLKKASRSGISKKAIYDGGDKDDIADWERLEEKYIRTTSYIKFG